ncbi:MAG: ABC transporter ATP-binding protein [Rhodobacteraceae bacterium]|nr:ABC transporter ATP-binding protein [Paracoccaceae bacterium]
MPDQLYAPPDGGDWPGSSNPDLAAEASSATPLEAERPLLRPAVPATSSATVDRPSAAPVLLSLAGVSTDIGPYHILDDVSFDVPVRGVTMLLGRNGAGKTTTLRTIMGLRQPRSGHIRFDGEDISGWPAHRIARAGLGYVPEDMGIFGSLSVAENMILAARSGPIPADRLDWLFSVFPALRTFWNAPAGTLSGGQKQMLAVARAMVERRRLYLIDEPTKGLAPAIMATLVKAIRDLKLQGAAVLLVEQNFAVARELGDRCVVLDDGRVAWSGSMTAIADDPDLQARLLGFDLERT